MKYLFPILLVALALAGCAHQPEPVPGIGLPGFWYGLWHGIVAGPAFIASCFTDVRIYAFPNSGVWYDFGFMLGVGGFGTGILRLLSRLLNGE